MHTKNHKRAPHAQDSVIEPTTVAKAAVALRDEVDNAQLVITSEKAPNARLVSRLVSAEDIRLCAYQKWENEGKPADDGIRFWLEAEQEVAQANSRG